MLCSAAMALIRIVDSWLRSPAGSPVHQRVVMVVADSWSEQRVLMRAYAESPDQTRPTIVLHGTQLAISPASTDPHGSWGIHVEPPVDGRAQELRDQLSIAAKRLAGSKGNPPRLADEAPRFDRKRTNNWAPGTPRDLPKGRGMQPGKVDARYHEPSAQVARPIAPAAPAAPVSGANPVARAMPAAQANPVPRAAPDAATISPFSIPAGPNRPAPGPFPHVRASAIPRPAATPPPAHQPAPASPPAHMPNMPIADDEQTLPGPVPAPLAVRRFLASTTQTPGHPAPGAPAADPGRPSSLPPSPGAGDPLTQPTYNGPTPQLTRVPGLGTATAGGGIANPAYSGQRAAVNAHARQITGPAGTEAESRGWSSPVNSRPALRDHRGDGASSPQSKNAASAQGRPRRATGRNAGKSAGSTTVTGFASGSNPADARSTAARNAAGFANLVGKTMPVGFRLSAAERTVLDTLASAGALSARQIAELAGVPDGAAWMSQLVAKLRSVGLDLVAESPPSSPGSDNGQPTYTIRR